MILILFSHHQQYPMSSVFLASVAFVVTLLAQVFRQCVHVISDYSVSQIEGTSRRSLSMSAGVHMRVAAENRLPTQTYCL